MPLNISQPNNMKSADIVKDSEKSWGKIPLSSILKYYITNQFSIYFGTYVVEDPIS